jgi:chromosome segregation ATPase
VEKVQFCLPSLSLWAVKPLRQAVEMVSNPSSVKAKGNYTQFLLTFSDGDRSSVSEVTIHLKNQGEEAYKPKEYGKSIHITRRFTKDGSSTWKIKSQDDKVISTKKDELAAICDHMNIQVDNPMNVLTQGPSLLTSVIIDEN